MPWVLELLGNLSVVSKISENFVYENFKLEINNHLFRMFNKNKLYVVGKYLFLSVSICSGLMKFNWFNSLAR